MSIVRDLNLSYVPRWVIVPMVRPQTVAEHSWRVAVIAWHLCERLNETIKSPLPWPPSAIYYMAGTAVFHDMEEVDTGDIPSSYKPGTPLPEEAIDLLGKVADIIETRTWLKMWGHPSVIRGILRHNDPKYKAALDALNRKIPGADIVARSLENEIDGGMDGDRSRTQR